MSADALPDDMSPRFASPLEWWTVSGWYEGASLPRRYFMLALRRQAAGPRKESGFSLLGAVVERDGRAVSTISRSERRLRRLSAALKPDDAVAAVDPRVLRAFRSELESGGFPSGAFEWTATSPRLSSAPFAAVWDDFALSRKKEGFAVCFRESARGPVCRFTLLPVKTGLNLTPFLDRNEAALSMSRLAIPRLRLSGRRGRDAVSGLAWLEHHWGDPLQRGAGRDDRRVKAWDHLRLQLANGEDWLVDILKDARTMSPHVRLLVVSDARGRARRLSDFELTPVEWWESPRTRVRYPVVWRLRVPDASADLIFRPFSFDQEIPVSDVSRAVWNGAGEAFGTVGGRRVRGPGRGELRGYGTIFDLRDHFRAQARRVDDRIASFLPRLSTPSDLARLAGREERAVDAGVYAEMLARPTWDLLDRGGKRWRPLFALYLTEALGAAPGPYEDLFCVLSELSHAGALIIDDIEDASRMRRRLPSIHLRYGLDAAVSAANTLYFLAALPFLNHPGLDAGQRLAFHEIFIRQMARAHFGQAVDLSRSRNMSEDAIRRELAGDWRGRILGMYALKTGALLEGLAEMCAVAAGADRRLRDACRAFGRSLGIGFQILDDIHGCGRSREWTKVRGEDIAQGKWTYVLAKALTDLPPADRARLTALVGRRESRRRSGDREAAIALIRRSGALAACRDEARAIVDRAWARIRPRLRPSEARARLALLYRDLMEMDFD